MTWNTTPEGQQLIADLSRSMVDQVAPEESDLFDEMLQDYYADPNPPETTRGGLDDALGFGLEGMMIAVTPAAAAMASMVLGMLVNHLVGTLQDKTIEAALGFIKRRLGGQKSEPSPLSKDQLKQVRDAALAQAAAYGLSAEQAEQMASALIGKLALGE